MNKMNNLKNMKQICDVNAINNGERIDINVLVSDMLLLLLKSINQEICFDPILTIYIFGIMVIN